GEMAYEEHVDPPDDFDGDSEEIDAEEREALQQDLIDVNTLKSVLASRGIKGVVVYCPDCEDDHFLGWDLLADNLRQILESGEPASNAPCSSPSRKRMPHRPARRAPATRRVSKPQMTPRMTQGTMATTRRKGPRRTARTGHKRESASRSSPKRPIKGLAVSWLAAPEGFWGS